MAQGRRQKHCFLSQIVLARRRFNFISEIQNTQGNTFYDDAKIEKAFIEYFSDIYTDNGRRNWIIGNLNWSCIYHVQAADLIRNLEEKEVISGINFLAATKLLDQMDSLSNSSKSTGTFSNLIA